MLRAAYWFYISKFIDFFDTIFFVLRKKNNQITMLHIIHHGLLPMSVWPGVRFTSGGQATFFAFLNTLVHIVMYFYYFVAAMGLVIKSTLVGRNIWPYFKWFNSSLHRYTVSSWFLSNAIFQSLFVGGLVGMNWCFSFSFSNFTKRPISRKKQFETVDSWVCAMSATKM